MVYFSFRLSGIHILGSIQITNDNKNKKLFIFIYKYKVHLQQKILIQNSEKAIF